MTLSFQPNADLSCADGLQSVTLRQPGGGSPVFLAAALRRQTAWKEAETSGGRVVAGDVDWHLPVAALATQPALGALLQDAGGANYRVLRVELATLGTRWVCHCRSLEITGELDRLITLERATWTKDASGVATAAWNVTRNSIAARIQPQTESVNVEQDRRLARASHRVYLAESVAIDQHDRVICGADIYVVLKIEQAERIDALPCLLVEQVSGALGFASVSGAEETP